MSKRARYVGPHPEVVIEDASTGYGTGGETVVVVRNGLLPKEAPASVRDSLLGNPTDWAEQADPSDSKKED